MATIVDVAKLAGVTPTTVSRVINNRGYISEKTKSKVYEAMKELNYQPNEIARSLTKQKTNTIGIIDSDYYNSDNEGHIMVKFSVDRPLTLHKGDKFCQGIFILYGVTFDDNADGIRNGGFGSTGN